MIRRTLEARLRAAAGRFPVVSITGPRQSGKTTLVRRAFPRHAYVSLEAPDDRRDALEDPRGFLARFNGPVIIDEAQRVPEIFSYLQVRVDEQRRMGQYIVTGSSNFLLMRRISQSLAGRCAVLHLLPFSLAELSGRRPLDFAGVMEREGPSGVPPSHAGRAVLDRVMFNGGYPPIHDRKIPPREWFGSYLETYVERDVRNLLRVGDLDSFGRFIRLCAGRSGQILNLSSLASDAGITHPTAKAWISVLQASFLVALLSPYHANFRKRLVRAPKLYWLDSGLLCYLLGIRSSEELATHPLRGGIFESWVASELRKNFLHRGEAPALSYWRDQAGHEVDMVVEDGPAPLALEIKAGATVAGDAGKGLAYWRNLRKDLLGPALIVYGGDRNYVRGGVRILPWWML